MEYTLDSYLRSGGKIFTTSNGYKYLKYKVKKTKAYLRCVLWKKGCKGTSKMNLDTDIIYPSSIHNHDIELYQSEVYDLKPMTVISDWESAPRNSFKAICTNINITGCWFHYTQRIWAKVQKLGLAESFRESNEISQFVQQLMAIPFLPASLISPTFLFIQLPHLHPTESMKLEKLLKATTRNLNQS